MAIIRSANQATPNYEVAHFQNPRLRPIFMFVGQTRDKIALPTLISPSPSPTDTALFEEPQDPSRRHYLPAYGLAGTTGAAGRVKWVSLHRTDTGVTLDVHLAETTDPAVAAANTRIDADTRFFITAAIDGQQVNWDLTLAPDNDGAAMKLTLALQDFASRDQLYRAMTDPSTQARLVIRRSVRLATPKADSPGLYFTSNIAIDSALPFTFNRDLDANVFAQVGEVSAGLVKAWNIVAVNWGGRRHTYIQSLAQPDQVYFLPDSFKIMRQDKAPHAPALSVSSSGDSATDVTLTLSYLAQPVWDPGRIADASVQLQRQLGLSRPPQLAIFEAVDARLALNLPSGAGGGAGMVEQPNALVDIAGGVRGSATLGLADFRRVYDALFDQVSPLLTGEVRVVVEGATTALPFIARAGDFSGDVLDIHSQLIAGKVVATLTNAIESPIHVEGLKGSLLKDGQPIVSRLTGVNPQPPIDLPPLGADPAASTLTVTLEGGAGEALLGDGVAAVLGALTGASIRPGEVAAGAIGGAIQATVDDSCTPLFDLGQVQVEPDPASLWRAIMQGQTLGPVNRAVTLRAIAAMLQPPATPDRDAALAIQVVFESGQTANFDASIAPDAAGFIDQTIKLSVPIEAYVLGSADLSGYRYRIDRITAGGVRQGEWVSDNRDVLFITSA